MVTTSHTYIHAGLLPSDVLKQILELCCVNKKAHISLDCGIYDFLSCFTLDVVFEALARGDLTFFDNITGFGASIG